MILSLDFPMEENNRTFGEGTLQINLVQHSAQARSPHTECAQMKFHQRWRLAQLLWETYSEI